MRTSVFWLPKLLGDARLERGWRHWPHQWSGGALEYHGFCCAFRPEVAEWIGQEMAFSSSMVDRITPTTTPRGRR